MSFRRPSRYSRSATFIGFGAAWDDLHHGIDGVVRRLHPAPAPERVSVYE